MLKEGIYEQVINRKIADELKQAQDKNAQTEPINEEEASGILAKYVSDVVEQGLNNLRDEGRSLNDQVSLTNKIVSLVQSELNESSFQQLSVDPENKELLALFEKQDSRWDLSEKSSVTRPETSIANSSLFTGAIHEPQMFSELNKEILSCDRIDMLVSFIKWSGLRLIFDNLKVFTDNGGLLRVITTSYMGATDIKAVEELSKLSNTQIKVSYDTKRTRLHAKAYMFYRESGFTVGYVGSSNLSDAAMSSGLEWNVKIAKKDQPDTIRKIEATFESYWNSDEFELYSETQQDRLAKALRSEKYFDSNNAEIYTLDIKPYYYQQEILDKLDAERRIRGYNHNLVVAATGTGKTVIAALDYKRFRAQNAGQPCRLLFIAHREEILKQSLYTFRAVLKDANFGEMYVGNYRPTQFDYLFMSIQTFNSQHFLEKKPKDYYDYIVVDEFHHAAAPSYKALLAYYQPKILLGLTATPERMDGKSILPYFNHRIAAEMRLPEAIDRKLLSPFQYFGVTDPVDLSGVRWVKGSYDVGELTRVYTEDGTSSLGRADWIVSSLLKYVTDIDEVKGLGFCASREHAAFMADYFNEHHIPSISLTGESLNDLRNHAKNDLVSGKIRFIFVVDIYNEGVDIPEVNTILFLRPTQSLTIFLQQLGRGLRLADGKECLTVLDFIGQANKKYNFEEKYAALLSNTSRSVSSEIKDGMVDAPKGCYFHFEKVAQQIILDNIRASYGNSAALISKIETFEEDTGLPLTYAHFLDYYHLEPKKIYKFNSFSRLCVRADRAKDFCEPLEEQLTKALGRLACIDSQRWIKFLLRILSTNDLSIHDDYEKRMLQMFQFTIWQKPYEECGFASLVDGVRKIKENPVMCQEMIDLLKYQLDQIDFVDSPVDVGFACPLDLHCTYSRDQILTAFDFLKPGTVREGVKYLPDKKVDLFFITLNKTDKEYSPSTMYNDYSINSTLFHWQSQSTTSDTSRTGQRYIHHQENGSNVLLFVREYKTDRATNEAMPYTYLGKATYVSHTGSNPMNVIWRLAEPIPAKFMKKTNKMTLQ